MPPLGRRNKVFSWGWNFRYQIIGVAFQFAPCGCYGMRLCFGPFQVTIQFTECEGL